MIRRRERRACVCCGRVLSNHRHKCPHGRWCFAQRGKGAANVCPECPDNGFRRVW
jgi:hypothetical protein